MFDINKFASESRNKFQELKFIVCEKIIKKHYSCVLKLPHSIHSKP